MEIRQPLDPLLYAIGCGSAKEKIRRLLDDNIFDSFSKHDPYWSSEFELEADKLNDIRYQFQKIYDELSDVYCSLAGLNQ